MAIDRVTQLALARVRRRATAFVATVFLMVLLKRVHCRVHTGLTDYGIQFAVAL